MEQPNWDDDFDSNSNVPAIREEKLPTAVAVDSARAIQEVQASYVMAWKKPRDTTAAISRILESCKRISLANLAMYSFPRGGKAVTGPTIRLAEEIARNYGNMECGWRETERTSGSATKPGSSRVVAHCTDFETNSRKTIEFEVEHAVGLKGGKIKTLTDPRDIYEKVANEAQRRLRACILAMVPGDIVEAAVKQCRATVAKGDGRPLIDRIREMVLAFKDLGVNQAMMEDYLGHTVDLTTGEEIVDLHTIFTSIKDKQAKRGDFFNFPDDRDDDSGKAGALKEKMGGQSGG